MFDPASLPRDVTVIVDGNPRLAQALAQRGHSVVHLGGEAAPAAHVPDLDTMTEQWSRLTARNPDVAVISRTSGIREAADYLAIRTCTNNSTSEYRARGWVEHLIANLHHLSEPCFAACGLDGGDGSPVPAFIVGAGASLDDDAPLLAQARARGVLIGINAGARLPEVHVALTVEGNDLRYKLGPLEHVQARAFAVTSDPSVMAHGSGALIPIFSGELGAVGEQLTGYQRLVSSSIGGTAAIALAARWGCSPIVLLGHDFAYRDDDGGGARVYAECLGLPDARLHTEGAGWRWEWPAEYLAQPRHNPLHAMEQACELPGVRGRMVRSTPALAGARQWVASFAHKSVSTTRIVQAASWGARIDDCIESRLDFVLEQLPEREVTLASHAPGVQPQLARYWLGLQLTGLDAAVAAARRIESTADVETLMRALRRAPLLEPWSHRRVAAVARERRAGPMDRNSARERSASIGHARVVGAVLADEAVSLRAALEAALRDWDEPACDLVDMPLPPGAATDVLRSALRTAAWHGRRPWTGRTAAALAAAVRR